VILQLVKQKKKEKQRNKHEDKQKWTRISAPRALAESHVSSAHVLQRVLAALQYGSWSRQHRRCRGGSRLYTHTGKLNVGK